MAEARCKTCTRDVPPDARFCPHCGAEQGAACAACGSAISGDFAFCPRCGAPRTTPRKNRSSSGIPRQLLDPAILPRTRRGERRVVTVLFADVVGFTKMSERYDPETLTEMMNRLFERFGAVVRRYEGVVDKFIGDAAMVLFGAPTSHEDDAERAVLTARDMMALLPAVNEDFQRAFGFDPAIALHVGIATGLVVAGSVGSMEGGGYTVMGDAVNLASRLVDLAPPSQIYIAESTHRLVGGRIRTEVVQTVRVKGKEDPVTVHRVTGADPAAGDSRGIMSLYSPLVGRDEELGVLRTALGSLETGAGCLVTIAGAAGLGKSRLVRESLEGVLVDGIAPRIHVGRSISYGRSVPYYPWSHVLASLLTESLMHRLKGEHLQVLQQVATGAFGSRTPAEAEKHRELVFWSFGKLLEAAAGGAPRILVLEDMHWADRTTIDLALSLAPLLAQNPIMIVLVYRPGSGSEAEQALGNAPLPERSLALHLPPLSLPDTRIQVQNLTCNVVGFPAELGEEIARRSEGVPLFAEEILRHYVDEGLLVRSGDLWRFDADKSIPSDAAVPTTLHALLAARIDRLREEERTRLELGSVIGKDFDPRLVDALLGFAHKPELWDRLILAGELLVAPDPAGGRNRYRFSHVLTQEVVYNTLLRARRQELHRAVALALESDAGGREENLHSLAWHFEQAAIPEKAAPYWLASARQAASVYANREAIDLYDHALEIAPSAAAAKEALVGKAELQSQMGRHADAAGSFDRLIEMAQARGDLAEEARWLARRSSLAYAMGDGPGILRFAERALEKARASSDPRAIARALRQIGVGHEFAGRYAPARRAYHELLAIEEPFADNELVYRVYNSMGEIARACDQFDEAIRWYDKSLGSQENPIDVTYLGNVGAALVGLGQHERALHMLDRAIAERRRTGYLAFISEAHCYRALANLGANDAAAASSDAAEALAQASAHRETEMYGLALRVAALVQSASGRAPAGAPQGVEASLRESIRVLHHSGKRGEEARSRWELARELRRSGNEAEAQREYLKALPMLRELGLDDPARVLDAEARALA
ncbi:MAG: adenylate/guanylate cyclase domain-containing protein [Acidobacteriota bacterium]